MKKSVLVIIAISTLSLSLIGCGFRTEPEVVEVQQVKVVKGPLVGHKAMQEDIVVYRTKGVVYRDGYAYHIRNGRYVVIMY